MIIRRCSKWRKRIGISAYRNFGGDAIIGAAPIMRDLGSGLWSWLEASGTLTAASRRCRPSSRSTDGVRTARRSSPRGSPKPWIKPRSSTPTTSPGTTRCSTGTTYRALRETRGVSLSGDEGSADGGEDDGELHFDVRSEAVHAE